MAISMFGAGPLGMAAVGVLVAVAAWRRGPALRAATLVVGLGLALYLPQFYVPAAGRVGHGLVLGLGCWAVAALNARTALPGHRSYVSTLPGSVVASAATKAS